MAENMVTKKESVSVDSMIEMFEQMYNNRENRLEFERFWKTFIVKASEKAVSNQNNALKQIINESEVFHFLIKEKLGEFDEISKEIYSMGCFEGAYESFNTWYKMYSNSAEFEKSIARVLNKKYVLDVVYCVKNQPGIQNKKILEKVGIKPNYLSELTSELIFYQIINRYRIGKNTFYELTPRAKEYFKQKEKKEIRIKTSMKKKDMYISLGYDELPTNRLPKSPYWEMFSVDEPKRKSKLYDMVEVCGFERSEDNV